MSASLQKTEHPHLRVAWNAPFGIPSGFHVLFEGLNRQNGLHLTSVQGTRQDGEIFIPMVA